MPDTTIVTAPASGDTGASGIIISFVLVALALVGGAIWYQYFRTPATSDTTNIQVTVPNPVTPQQSN